jgi:hypothetical protein
MRPKRISKLIWGHLSDNFSEAPVPFNRRTSTVKLQVTLDSKNRDSQVRALQPALVNFALFLIDQGITNADMHAAMSCAFVRAAVSRSRKKNGSVNQSRVAIMTGITRTEVRKLLEANIDGGATSGIFGAHRILEGWNRDPEFLTRDGKPKKLSLGVGYGSFARLVRKYSADVPPRATLDELKRLNTISLSGGFATLVRRSESESRRRVRTMSRVALQLSKVFQLMGYPDFSSPSTSMLEGTVIEFSDKPTLRMAEQRAEKTARAFLSSIESSGKMLVDRRVQSGKRKANRLLLVRVSISTSSPSR